MEIHREMLKLLGKQVSAIKPHKHIFSDGSTIFFVHVKLYIFLVGLEVVMCFKCYTFIQLIKPYLIVQNNGLIFVHYIYIHFVFIVLSCLMIEMLEICLITSFTVTTYSSQSDNMPRHLVSVLFFK